jgi:transglutaminase-like putative cysteine protease
MKYTGILIYIVYICQYININRSYNNSNNNNNTNNNSNALKHTDNR